MIPPPQQLIEAIERASHPAQFHAALRVALRAFDRLNEGAQSRIGVSLACKSGCFLCCYMRVDVSAPEAFMIADHLKTHLPTVEYGKMLRVLQESVQSTNHLTADERLKRNIECPFLRTGMCSVYAVRPLGCRRHHAQDFAGCQFSYDNPEDLEYPGTRHGELLGLLSTASVQFVDAYRRLGFDPTVYELGSAVLEALEDSSCWQRWRRKKRTFLRALVVSD